MKITFRNIEPFVKSPDPAAMVILVYGPDYGLMQERAKTMGQTVVADTSDPFNVAVLSSDILSEDPARLSDEANAMSMMGGRRLVRVEGASDKITPLIKEYLENPNSGALIILEAGEMGPRSSLRLACEKAKNAAAIPCYVEDERDLGRLIQSIMQENNLRINRDAAQWLAANISGNRKKVRAELEKLITYKGQEQSEISLADALAACGQAGAQNYDDLIYAVAGGQPEKAMKAFHTLTAEGVAVISILRTLQSHYLKLHGARGKVESGMSPHDATKSIKPSIFFKQQSAFTAQLSTHNSATLMKILTRLNELEAQTKRSGTPIETLCAQTILGLSMRKPRRAA